MFVNTNLSQLQQIISDLCIKNTQTGKTPTHVHHSNYVFSITVVPLETRNHTMHSASGACSVHK